ncbi:hypothetical protein [Paraflavitalea sp. CAU 1676]|uniref:hypothetical protein n=1 Tax=Paraflavitalea sp. CAU 1676 TaxID=3032598 RepID=UPI0023DC60C8|nr:hypothetical protein [Paraflavitalea sp. CAU 1676]MDF2188345.1 hypothetical protein [Paraflavitalea sp. CAU 1676]
MTKQFSLLLITCLAIASVSLAQQKTAGWLLDSMPASLETDYALSALPPHLRSAATVYLLDPKKGYYLARKGTNGFCTYVNRTEWERAEFVQDTYAAISYDSVGSTIYLPVAFAVAAMRASGKYSPQQIRDTIVQRVKAGIYKAPARTGISYMLSPLLRTRLDEGIVNHIMPHYMFYAPNLENVDVGGKWVSGGHQPFVINSGEVLDKAHSIFNFIILAAGESEKAQIIADHQALLKRLADYKPILALATNKTMEHGH